MMCMTLMKTSSRRFGRLRQRGSCPFLSGQFYQYFPVFLRTFQISLSVGLVGLVMAFSYRLDFFRLGSHGRAPLLENAKSHFITNVPVGCQGIILSNAFSTGFSRHRSRCPQQAPHSGIPLPAPWVSPAKAIEVKFQEGPGLRGREGDRRREETGRNR